MALYAKIMDVARTDDAFSIIVSYADAPTGGQELARKTMRFPSGTAVQEVRDEIQRQGANLNSVISGVSNIQAIIGQSIPIT